VRRVGKSPRELPNHPGFPVDASAQANWIGGRFQD